MEIEDNEEKSIDSFKAEMDLVKEEEEEENRLSQKERLAQILSKIKNQNNQENDQQPESDTPQVLRANPNVLRAAPKKIQDDASKVPEPFDPNFKLNERYFYQNINVNEWGTINEFIEKYINENMDEHDLETFFESHPKIAKGNILKLQNAIDNIFSQKPNLEKYKKLINFIAKKYFKPKPVICECYFFPNPSNEQRVVNMFRTCKKTLDLAIFTFTRDSIAQAILEAHQRGVKIRCIGDDGNSKVKGSDVRLLASIGIPCKTDNNLRFHMHNKMAIIDNSVVITGSFNWTSQAVNKNQDNILFIEDKNIAGQYTEYYNKIWDSFNTVITQEEAKQYLANEKKAEEEKKAAKEQNTNPAPKKEINKKETTKKETTKKETAKKETTKKETTKKETTKKTSTSKGTKKATTTKKSESKPKEKKETTTKKSTSTTKKKETSTTKKKTTVKKETSKKSKSETKEKKKPATSKTKETKKTSAKTSKAKPKTVKEQKKEKNAKKKTEPKKRVRGVKTNKEKNTKKK